MIVCQSIMGSIQLVSENETNYNYRVNITEPKTMESLS